jgi:hypothetical protein
MHCDVTLIPKTCILPSQMTLVGASLSVSARACALHSSSAYLLPSPFSPPSSVPPAPHSVPLSASFPSPPQFIQDYSTPDGKSLSRDLTQQLNTIINFLVECRPLSVSMGNAIKFIKLKLSKVHTHGTGGRGRECASRRTPTGAVSFLNISHSCNLFRLTRPSPKQMQRPTSSRLDDEAHAWLFI